MSQDSPYDSKYSENTDAFEDSLDSTPVTVLPYHPRSFRRTLLRKIADRNPFYLLSAACMLAGCLALTNSLSWVSLPLPRLLLLIATLNIYEAALIGLSILLLSRGLLRDGKILLIVEAFFLVDVTFLNAEIATANLRVGLLINLALLIVTALKLRLVMKALGANLSPGKFLYVLAQLVTLLAIPCVIRSIDHGSVSAGTFYAAWWIVGMMPVIRELTAKFLRDEDLRPASGPAAVYMLLPWISLIAHLGILHYVYDVPFYAPMVTPLLLGLTLSINRVTLTNKDPALRALRLVLPVGAVLVSLDNPAVLALSLKPLAHVLVGPKMIAIAAAYLVCVYCFALPLAAWFLAAGALAAVVVLYGPSPADIQRTTWRTFTWIGNTAHAIVPHTLAGWGMISVVASFFFLLLGAAISLTRPREE